MNHPPATYPELLIWHPPVPIADEGTRDAALAAFEQLMQVEPRSADQQRFAMLLVTLIDAWERMQHPVEPEDADDASGRPLDNLRHLMSQEGMNANELGRLLGDRTLGSRILSGKRQLTVKYIRILSRYFGVGAEVFI